MTRADQAFDIGFHDQLQDSLGNGAQELAPIVFCQKLGQVHVGLGHRGLGAVCGRSRQTPPRANTSMAARDHTVDGAEITPAPRTLTSFTAATFANDASLPLRHRSGCQDLPHGVAFEPRLFRLVALHIRQTRDAVPLKTPMQR